MAGLDQLLGQLLGGSGGSGSFDAAKLQTLIAPLMGMLQQQGGLSSMLNKLQQGGLGGPVDSWLQPGENEPVDADALGNALGAETVDELATESGMSPEEVKGGLSQLLPGLVDKLSPTGQLPVGTDQLTSVLNQIPGGDQLGGMLGGLLGGNK